MTEAKTNNIIKCPACGLDSLIKGCGCSNCDYLVHEIEADKGRKPTVGERLADLGRIYDERAAVYGDNYRHFGEAMMGLFPRGLELKTAEDFNRLGLFFHVMSKASRYAQCLARGEGHFDSLSDLAVYAMMAQECDDVKGKT